MEPQPEKIVSAYTPPEYFEAANALMRERYMKQLLEKNTGGYSEHDRHFIGQLFERVKELQAEVEQSRAEAEKLRQLVSDHCEEDTEIRNIARPYVGNYAADGDSHGVPPLSDVVEALVDWFRKPPKTAPASVFEDPK